MTLGIVVASPLAAATSTPATNAYVPARLAARAEIEDRIHSWARGIDRRDWRLAESIFLPNAVVHHGPTSTPAAMVSRLAANHTNIPFSSHHVSNIIIEFVDENTALAESYVLAILRPTDRAGEQKYVATSGRYLDRFERRNGEWRIAERTTVFDAMLNLSGPALGPPTSDWAVGERGQNDPLFTVRRAQGLSTKGAP